MIQTIKICLLLLFCRSGWPADANKKSPQPSPETRIEIHTENPNRKIPYLAGIDFHPIFELSESASVRTLSPFQLTNQLGKSVTTETIRGKATVVSFFFTKCPKICPLMIHNLQAVQEKFYKDNRLLLLSFSITPETDTPAELRKYAKDHHILSKRWHLLTGERDAIYRISRESFGADAFSTTENSKLRLQPEEFVHSESIYLIDGEQRLRGIYSGQKDSAIKDLIRDADLLLQ